MKPPTGLVVSPKELVIKPISAEEFVRMCSQIAELSRNAGAIIKDAMIAANTLNRSLSQRTEYDH